MDKQTKQMLRVTDWNGYSSLLNPELRSFFLELNTKSPKEKQWKVKLVDISEEELEPTPQLANTKKRRKATEGEDLAEKLAEAQDQIALLEKELKAKNKAAK